MILRQELEKLRKKTVAQTAALLTLEEQMMEAEDKRVLLEARLAQQRDALARRREEEAALLMQLVQVSRVPPAALLAMPGPVEDTLRAGRLLEEVTGALSKRLEELRTEIRAVEETETEIRNLHETLASRRDALEAERRKLDTQMEERQQLEAKLGRDHQKLTRTITRLGREATSLKQLIAEAQSLMATRPKLRPAASPPTEEKSWLRPAVGRLLRAYGQSTGRDGRNHGMVLATRPHSTVIASRSGQVMFAGPFLSYGQMVILRHPGDFHSLMSGLAQLTVAPGQEVTQGEPVGRMGNSEEELYIELRRGGKPVDPAGYFK